MIEAQPAVLSLSDAAAVKLHELTKEETNPNIGLRVYVYSGGCSGYRYGMMLEDAPTEEDRTFEENGVKVYVDGRPFASDPRTIELTDHKEIAVVIGTPPKTIPSTADFSQA